MEAIIRAVADRMIAAHWTAGLEPDVGTRIGFGRIARTAVRHDDEWSAGIVDEIALRALTWMRIGADPALGMPRVLGVAGMGRDDAPSPGHVVRLTRPWSILKAGDCMTLSGRPDAEGFTIGRGGHYASRDAVSLSSGGPSSMLRLPGSAFVPTGEHVEADFWRFRHDTGEAHAGVYFIRRVPIWEWDADDADFHRLDMAA